MQGLNEPYKLAIEKEVIILASPKPGLRIIHTITTSIVTISCKMPASVCLLLAVCKSAVIKVPWTEPHAQGLQASKMLQQPFQLCMALRRPEITTLFMALFRIVPSCLRLWVVQINLEEEIPSNCNKVREAEKNGSPRLTGFTAQLSKLLRGDRKYCVI